VICLPINKPLQVTLNTTLGELATIFDRDHFALVVTEQRCYTGGESGSQYVVRSVVSGIVTRIDLLNFISFNPLSGSPRSIKD